MGFSKDAKHLFKAKKNGLTKSGEFVKPMDKNKSTSHDEIKGNDTPSETKT